MSVILTSVGFIAKEMPILVVGSIGISFRTVYCSGKIFSNLVMRRILRTSFLYCFLLMEELGVLCKEIIV
jgi:hypothetical protein